MSTVCEVPRLCVHVIVRVEPAPQVTAVFAVVTVIRLLMVKLTSLMSDADAELTRMRACAVDGPLTSQAYVSDAPVVVKVPMGVQLAPPSRLTSMFTSCPAPRLCVNVTFCDVPDCQVTAVLGAVTAIVELETTSEVVAGGVRLPPVPGRGSGYAPPGGPPPPVTVRGDDPRPRVRA